MHLRNLYTGKAEREEEPCGSVAVMPWFRYLPMRDYPLFVKELFLAATTSRETVAECIDGWRETAFALSNPDSRAVLLGHEDG